MLKYIKLLCQHDSTAWNALEYNHLTHDNIAQVEKISAQLQLYHFAPAGSTSWWVRDKLGPYGGMQYNADCKACDGDAECPDLFYSAEDTAADLEGLFDPA